MRQAALLIVCCGLMACPVAMGQALDYGELAARLTDLERLASLPEPGEACAQWSSWDRASSFDAASGKYVGWSANGDGDKYIREENGQYVLAEMEGPGCIWRIWSARPEDGHVRIYLDGATEPAVDLPFKAYFDGSSEPFTRGALCYESARGWNCYVPIPYQRSCKIVADKGWGRYYHFTYGTFPPGTTVPAFSRNLDAAGAKALDDADRFLSRMGENPVARRPGQSVKSKRVRVRPHGRKCVAQLHGPAAITSIRAFVELPPAPADQAALRELALQIRWDGEKEPSVWAPFADFFGTAAGPNVYRSLPMGHTDGGWWYSHWYMPFAKRAVVELVNDGDVPRSARLKIVHAPLTADPADLGRFHAKWHRDAFLPKEPERAIDWPMVITEGRGRFCGVNLHVWNPEGGWWGEGDEKFFVDGEVFPSTFGTGSEDYFGYAWGNPTLFARAYHNQTISMANRGHISVNRWHITDNVPFQTSFAGCIEKYFPNDRPCLFAATAYWYLAPGGVDAYAPVPVTERWDYCAAEIPPPLKVRGAMEGERMKVVAKSAGNARRQELAGRAQQWSDSAQLWWTDAQPGDTLDLAFPVRDAGKYTLIMAFTQARDYGVVQVYVDGEKARWPIDLFHRTVRPYGPFDMGVVDLAAGDHTLRIEIVGANSEAEPRHMAGVDYVRLEPAE
ncbi:MAG: DUF2961 domain-containing protein [Candidatus Hydrogenedentes bacterium]|nr:DUF2961 domain-containing protein [Candidatus Hydrogenedentota bacterium]